jgi:capsular exopolysaccharide synthesis family protein
VDLAGYLAVLRRRVIPIVLCVAAGLAGGLALAFSGHSVYRSTARTLVNVPAATQLQDALAGAQLSEHLLQTYAQIATSNAVAARAAALAGVDVGRVKGALSAHVEAQTFLIDVTASTGSRDSAQRIANAAAQALTVEVAELGKSRADPVTVQVLDGAPRPGAPVSPRRTFDVVLGLLLGLVVGFALASALEALDRTIKGTAQGARAFRTRLLATVPPLSGRGLLVVSRDGASPAVEAFRALRTAVQYTASTPLRHLLVTSPSTGDGKTTVAANLAEAIALGGSTVALVDADLRDGYVARAFGLPRDPGVSSVVNGHVATDDALHPCGENLWVMTSGEPVAHSAEMLGSQGMVDLIGTLSDFDVVIFDVPAVLPVTDPVVLASFVDGVILVARHGRTERAAAVETRRRLDAVGANVVGFVLNAAPRRETDQATTGDLNESGSSHPTAAGSSPAAPARLSS